MIIERSVSVVIPTYQRHEEVIRAIKSALAQEQPPLEVVVVNDGPDAEKARLIAEMNESSVRFIEAPRKQNAAATRNFGIAHAKGHWIGLLDDDDVWRPNKLSVQFSALDEAGYAEAILVACEQVHVGGRPSYKRPSRPIPLGTAADEVLFIFDGFNTSTIVAPKKLFLDCPMNEKFRIQEDWSWVLNAGQSLPILVSSDIVCDRFLGIGAGLTRPGDFDYGRAWYEEHKPLIGPSSRAALVSGSLSRKAAYDRKVLEIFWLFAELAGTQHFSVKNVARLVRPWIIPFWARRWMKENLLSFIRR